MEARQGDDRDADLWAAACSGDEEAFGCLFDRYSARVFRHASRLVADVHDAEDVTATAFLELWRRRDDVRLVDGSVLPWLLVTTTNVSRNVRRAARRYRTMLDRLPRQSTAGEPQQEVLDRTSHLDPDLLAALHGLKPADLHVFALVALEGFSVADAATALHLSPGSARNRLHRSRQHLRRTLRPAATAPLEEK
jgi:RNA polymerase sigma factor (sigma-70 family)